MPATSPDDIIDLLSRIREQANQHICDELARRGITDLLPAHGAVLHALFEESPQPMSTLARRIGRKKNTVTGLVDTLQERGRMFVSPGDECYEGMLVGESAKEGDMVVNVEKTKQLGNQRSSTADKAIQLTPPITFTLEEALEYIQDDEQVEVTPLSIRMRKRILSTIDRKKEAKRMMQG